MGRSKDQLSDLITTPGTIADAQWGPSTTIPNTDPDRFDTAAYLKGYAEKIKLDLLRVAQGYNGRKIRIWRPKDPSKVGRCPYCTNAVTGERLLSDCPFCYGTGIAGGWDLIGDAWAYGDIGAAFDMATPNGNTDAEGNTRDRFTIVGCDTLLKDQDLFAYFGNRDIYKIYDAEPFHAAMQGTVVAQIASAVALTAGSVEFILVKDWEE